MYDVLIIGGGPVGIFASYILGLDGLSCAIIEANSELGGQCKTVYGEKNIYDLPGIPKIKSSKLVDNLIEQAFVFNPKIFLNEFVISVKNDCEKFNVLTKNGLNIESKTVLLALGHGILWPIKLSQEVVKNLESTKILYNFEIKKEYANKIMVVLGGGDSALDHAIELSKIAAKVYLVHRREKFKCHFSSYNKLKYISNLELKVPYLLEDVKYENNLSIVIKNENKKEELFVDYIFPCYGMNSNLSFIQEWDLELIKNKIKVDISSMQTSKKGIYALGDCVSYFGKRNLLLSGFNEALLASKAIFHYVYPDKIFNTEYSTSSLNR